MAVRQSVSGGAYLIRMLVFGLYFSIIVTFSVWLINEMSSLTARRKSKKKIFAAVILVVFAADYLVARKCCVSWLNGLALSVCATAIYAFVVGTFYFDRAVAFCWKGEEKTENLKGRDFLWGCLPVLAISLLSYGAYCRGYGRLIFFLIWLFSSLAFLAAIAILDLMIGQVENQRWINFIRLSVGKEKLMNGLGGLMQYSSVMAKCGQWAKWFFVAVAVIFTASALFFLKIFYPQESRTIAKALEENILWILGAGLLCMFLLVMRKGGALDRFIKWLEKMPACSCGCTESVLAPGWERVVALQLGDEYPAPPPRICVNCGKNRLF